MTSPTYSFFVPGIPKPGGSKTAFRLATGRVVVTDACKGNKSWRAVVALVAAGHVAGRPLLTGALRVRFEFVQSRPKSHFRGGKFGGELRADARQYPTSKPDVLKLSRSCEDSMSQVVYFDDAQTVQLEASKSYGETPGCHVTVWEVEGGGA